MAFKTIACCLLLSCYALGTIATPVITSDVDELVAIPGGMIERSRVHIVPEGGKIVHSATQVQLLDADGKVLHSSALKPSIPHFNVSSNTRRTTRSEPVVGPRSLQDATVLALAQSATVLSFGSDWPVPPLPQVNSGQLLMYFAALAPPNIDALIQPTLQYGVSAAGGGAFWSVASWFITPEQVFVTNLIPLTPTSSMLHSFVVDVAEFEGAHFWSTGFVADQLVNQTVGLSVQTTETFNVAIVALEVTNAITIGNLPSGPTDVEHVFILDSNDQDVFPIPWQFSSDPLDGITINRIPNTLVGEETLFFLY